MRLFNLFGQSVLTVLLGLALTSNISGQNSSPAQNGAPVQGRSQAAGPVSMTECEGTNNCATWTFLGAQGNGQWPSGELASLSVEHYDADSVVIRRADSSGPSAGLTAVYKGTRHGNRIGGEYTSSWPGHWNNQEGNWYATIGRASLTPPGVMRVCNQHICGTWRWNNGHYNGVWDGIPKTAIITVASFSPESVIFNRTDNDDGRTFVLKGKISSQGNSIIDGEQVRDDGALHSFSAYWGDALHKGQPAEPHQPMIVGRPVVCYGWFFVVCE